TLGILAAGTFGRGLWEILAVAPPPAIVQSVGVNWGAAGAAALQTAGDEIRLLPAGRTTSVPWLNVDRLIITLSQPAALASADVSAVGVAGGSYGPVTISGLGSNYVITLAKPIAAADRVTVTIGNATIAPFTRRL